MKVITQVRSNNVYVGQAIDLYVGVIARDQRPTVTTPIVANATCTPLEIDMKPISAGGIGTLTFQKNLFRSHFRLVARKPGPLTIPPVAASLGPQSGASAPLAIPVKPLPNAGRTSEFLGGVGPFEVDSSAEPASVRAGGTIEYRITIEGAGALGVDASPSLEPIAKLPLGFQVERRPDLVIPEPPSHTFVYRLRPTKPGEAALPPVRVAAFDPKTMRYVTKLVPSRFVRVRDVPVLDPSRVAYAPTPPSPPGPTRRARILLIASALIGTAGLALWLIRHGRNRRASRVAPQLKRLVAQLESRLTAATDDAERGRAITEGLITYLQFAASRPAGALTPSEAARGFRRATNDLDLAERAAELVSCCDRVQFGRNEGVTTRPIAEIGRAFFRDLLRLHSTRKVPALVADRETSAFETR